MNRASLLLASARVDARGATCCSRCGQTYSHDTWRALPALHRLGPAEIAEYVTTWPSQRSIAIRACAGCGLGIARLE